MAEPTEIIKAAERKASTKWRKIILRSFVVLVIYILSAGPLTMMQDKNLISSDNKLWILYAPVGMAYFFTPLHKPLGIYLHLWSKQFDKHGEFNMVDIGQP